MKHQALFSTKDKIKKLKCRLLQFSFGALRVKTMTVQAECMKKFTDRSDCFFSSKVNVYTFS